MEIYLDNSATTRQYDSVTETMLRVFSAVYGNPSSLHQKGVDAEKEVREARREVARNLGVSEKEVFFTSGGTESDNWAVKGVCRLRKRQGNRIVTTAGEHPAVLESVKELEKEGFEAVIVPVSKEGFTDLAALEKALTPETVLLSVMLVNNEVGSIQPAEEIDRIRTNFQKETGVRVPFHCDAVQAMGKQDLSRLPADLITVSAHKIHGPKGAGALAVRRGVRVAPLLSGGGQEGGLRSGTENVPAIAGFGAAAARARLGLPARQARLQTLKRLLSRRTAAALGGSGFRFNGACDSRYSDAVLNISFPGIRGEVLVHLLEQEQIFVSTGSACSSRKKGGSRVLEAMGLSRQEIEGAVRFSFSEFNTEEEMLRTADAVAAAVNRLRNTGSLRR